MLEKIEKCSIRQNLKRCIFIISIFIMPGCLSFGRTGGCNCEKEYVCMMADSNKMSDWITECSKNGSPVKDCTESAKQIFCIER